MCILDLWTQGLAGMRPWAHGCAHGCQGCIHVGCHMTPTCGRGLRCGCFVQWTYRKSSCYATPFIKDCAILELFPQPIFSMKSINLPKMRQGEHTQSEIRGSGCRVVESRPNSNFIPLSAPLSLHLSDSNHKPGADFFNVYDQGGVKKERTVRGIQFTHTGTLAWSVGHDGALVCTDLTTCQPVSSTSPPRGTSGPSHVIFGVCWIATGCDWVCLGRPHTQSIGWTRDVRQSVICNGRLSAS